MNQVNTSATIPTFEDLDAAWFTTALRSSGTLGEEHAVTSVASSRIGEGEGMASRLWRFSLTYGPGAPATSPGSVVVKLATDDPHRLFIFQSGKFYAREVRFYAELAADAPVRVPRCLYGAIEPESSMFVLVLEDVGELRHVDQLTGGSFEDAVQALQTLAKIHAKWWAKDMGDLEETFMPMNNGFNQFVVPMLHNQSWPAARDARPDLWPKDVSAFLDGYGDKIPQVLEGLMGPNTLIHNDYRVDNLLWDGDEIVVLDFQMSSIASGLLDFAYFVAQSLPKELRKARFGDLLDSYLSALAANGVTLDRDAAIDRYRRCLVFGLMWPCGLMGGYATLDPRGKVLAETMLDRHLSALADSGALSLYP